MLLFFLFLTDLQSFFQAALWDLEKQTRKGKTLLVLQAVLLLVRRRRHRCCSAAAVLL